MEKETCVIWIISTFGLIALLGFFKTKKPGYGRFNTSTLLVILVIIFSSLFFAIEKVTKAEMLHIFFSIIGFAGGLFSAAELRTEKREIVNKTP